MDKKVEKSNCDKVLRRFTNRIKPLGFRRVKPTFWVREKEQFVQFLHVHKYTFGPCFRIHTCLRPFNASFQAIALIGPTEKELEPEASFDYEETEQSVELCAVDMASFVQRHSEPWFTEWSEPKSLVSSESPLDERHRKEFKQALEGNVNPQWVKLTKELLKIA